MSQIIFHHFQQKMGANDICQSVPLRDYINGENYFLGQIKITTFNIYQKGVKLIIID